MSTRPHNYAASLQDFAAAVLAADSAVRPYTNNYRGAHTRALRNVYPRVCAQLGEAIFNALAQVYLRHYPPAHWDLNLYGEHFPELLQAQVHGGRATEFDWPGLAAIGRSEYADTLAYYAQDETGDSG